MKKVILITGLIILLAGCKRSSISLVPPDCLNVMVINEGRTTAAWRNTNSQYICQTIDGKIYVDIDDIPENANETARATWLQTNRNYINFYESYRFIEDNHRYKSTTDMTTIDGLAHYKDVKVSEMKELIYNAHGDYDYDRYDNYMQISVPTTGVTMSRVGYSNAIGIYSIPLFRSIVEVNGLGKDDKIQFAAITLHNKAIIVMKVKTATATLYYDFSDNPTKK